ncbi:hypothetical protein SCLCIDRAFT_970791 [Scleroderma citrinum Foug A]|uniref:Uncharacterized protein n=1 Tax=Scleroderma citrinum Foug A TaxID=1036808 RepID=A0A0C3DVC7_9AGAM|nr:hypothetical protein SCLCIDRAFT_970791 [Scleroderma citrinum Foug A]
MRSGGREWRWSYRGHGTRRCRRCRACVRACCGRDQCERADREWSWSALVAVVVTACACVCARDVVVVDMRGWWSTCGVGAVSQQQSLRTYHRCHKCGDVGGGTRYRRECEHAWWGGDGRCEREVVVISRVVGISVVVRAVPVMVVRPVTLRRHSMGACVSLSLSMSQWWW